MINNFLLFLGLTLAFSTIWYPNFNVVLTEVFGWREFKEKMKIKKYIKLSNIYLVIFLIYIIILTSIHTYYHSEFPLEEVFTGIGMASTGFVFIKYVLENWLFKRTGYEEK